MNKDMIKRRKLMAEFKQVKTYMGVYQIKNTVNGKIYIEGNPNIKNKWFTLSWTLNDGRFANSGLQNDWKQFGADAFEYQVLEEKDTEGILDVRYAAKQLEKEWLEKLQPYGDKGYNKPPKE